MPRASGNLAVTVLGVAVAIVVAGVAWFGTGSDPVPTAMSADTTASSNSDRETMTVHVSGAVVEPGLVALSVSARVADAVQAAGGVASDADLSAINLAAPISDGDLIVVPRVGESMGQAGSPRGVDLNRATATELEALPGVGPVLAERIVSFRDQNGPFATVEDLLGVPGIGEAKLRQMRSAIARP